LNVVLVGDLVKVRSCI